MKIIMMVSVLFTAGCILAQDTDLIGFWDFKGGNPGSVVDSVTSVSGTSMWNGSVVKTGNAPTYSANVPAPRIYSSSTDHTPVAENFQSVHFSVTNGAGTVGNGGCIDIYGLSSAIAGLDAFTIEYFARYDYNQGNPYCVMVNFMSGDSTARVACGLGNGKSQIALYSSGQSTVQNSVEALFNSWHHYAIVYKGGKITLYVDSVSKGSTSYSNAAIEAGSAKSGVFRVGALFDNTSTAYAFRGCICALRVKSTALEPKDFMCTGYGYVSPTIGFWSFNEGAAGTPVETVSNTMGDNVFTARATALFSNGMVPAFDADVPGKVIYGSSDFNPANCLSCNIQSVRFFNKDGKSHKDGGKLTFADLGSMLSQLGDYTLEFFFKDEDVAEDPWEWWSFICSWNADGMHQVTIDSKKQNYGGAVAFAACGKAGYYYPSSSFIDGRWHHCAVVHDASEKASAVYIDYKKGANAVAAPVSNVICKSDFVLGTSLDQSSAEGQANYAFRGKIAALRITARALTEAQFMVAADEVIDPDTVFAWDFENGAAMHGSRFANPTAVAYPLDAYFADWNYSVLDSSVPIYAARAKSKVQVFWGSVPRGESTTCIRFSGYHGVTESEKESASGYWQYAGTVFRREGSSSERLNQNPKNWTMEMFVRPEYCPWNSAGSGLFAKAGNGKINQMNPQTESRYALTPQMAWGLLWNIDGSLTLHWTENDGAVDPASSEDGTGGVAKSKTFPGNWLSVGVWRHVALTYDSESKAFFLYVDGVLAGTACVGEGTGYTLWDGPYEYQFGRCMVGYGFEGMMDEIRFSRIVRTPESFVSIQKSGLSIIVR